MLVAGASGYLGSRLVPRLHARGRVVRALVRGSSPAPPHLERAELARGDLADPASLRHAAEGADTVIHLVGIIRERGAATFEAVHVQGTQALVQAARASGVRRFLYVSAIGARLDAATAYWRSKARAEAIVRESGMEWIVLRPSIVFARDGEICRVLRRLTAVPLVPVLGPGTSRLAPIRADDLADTLVAALDRPAAWNRLHEAAGPEAFTFDQLLKLAAHGRPLVLLHLPLALARPLVALVSPLPFAPVTTDQLAMLLTDSVADPAALREAFAVDVRSIRPILAGEDAA